MENRLISMVDFVFLMRENKKKDNIRRFWTCERYANFLSQPLQKWMFVPCGEDGEVLEVPQPEEGDDGNYNYQARFLKYQQAKDRCLFEGFEMHELDNLDNQFRFFINDKCLWNTIRHNNKTIEDLIKHNLTLTATALKQIEG